MGAHSLDIEFSKYWTQLTPVQKQSLLGVIKTFFAENTDPIEVNVNELQEPEAQYNVPWHIFKPLSKQQKKALISFLESSGIEPAGRISIEQYNKEIDEAMARVDAGEFYTQEEVEVMLKTRLSGIKP